MSDMKFTSLLLGAVLLAACAKDELADDTRLPEGQYPLRIAAVTLGVEGGEARPWGAPQTRVGETDDGTGSLWDGDEEIGVQIAGSTEAATYTVRADSTVFPTLPSTGRTPGRPPSPPGIPLRTAPSTSATKPTALPTCCAARARATIRPR